MLTKYHVGPYHVSSRVSGLLLGLPGSSFLIDGAPFRQNIPQSFQPRSPSPPCNPNPSKVLDEHVHVDKGYLGKLGIGGKDSKCPGPRIVEDGNGVEDGCFECVRRISGISG